MATKRGTQSSERKPAKAATRRRARSGAGGKRARFFLMAVLLGGAAAGVFYAMEQRGLSVEQVTRTVVDKVSSRQSQSVNLYFADPRWTKLVVQQRTIDFEEDPVERVRQLVELLISGPRDDAGAILPGSARLRGVYLGPGGLAVIDFEPGMDELRSYGAGGEMLSVFALVHTICENVEEIKSVQILVGGQEQETLAGHVRISEPLSPRPDLIGTGGQVQ